MQGGGGLCPGHASPWAHCVAAEWDLPSPAHLAALASCLSLFSPLNLATEDQPLTQHLALCHPGYSRGLLVSSKATFETSFFNL